MPPRPTLELIAVPDPEAARQHDELLDLLCEGLALALLEEARVEAEAALGRPLRSAAALADQEALPGAGPRATAGAPRATSAPWRATPSGWRATDSED